MGKNQQLILATVVAIFGEQAVKQFENLLRASQSRSSVVEVFQKALEGKYKAETERLSGKVLTRMTRDGWPEDVVKRTMVKCGIGYSRDGESFAIPHTDEHEQVTQ